MLPRTAAGGGAGEPHADPARRAVQAGRRDAAGHQQDRPVHGLHERPAGGPAVVGPHGRHGQAAVAQRGGNDVRTGRDGAVLEGEQPEAAGAVA